MADPALDVAMADPPPNNPVRMLLISLNLHSSLALQQHAVQQREMRIIIDKMKEGVNQFSQEMFGETRNEDAQVAVLGPLLLLTTKILGVSLDPRAEAEPETPLTLDRRPRDAIGNREQQVMRVWVKEHWERRNAPVPESGLMTRFLSILKDMDLWRDRRHHLYLEPFKTLWNSSHMTDETRVIQFANEKSNAATAWNRGMAAFVLERDVIPLMNSSLPQRARTWEGDIDWTISMIGRIADHCQYRSGVRRRNAAAKANERKKARRDAQLEREFALRVKVASIRGWRKTESALRKLGHDGMSSDEEEDETAVPRRQHVRIVHHHPWRSRRATQMVRRLQVAVDQFGAEKGRVGNVRNERKITDVTDDPTKSSRRHNPVPELLPDNFYNWEILGNREFHKNLNRPGGANARRVLRPKPATDELEIEHMVLGD
ncbi:hypothetical protein V5O48_001836 [Marasmius crinis-equi]|uniref:Uncharacterized protein n=1 Tax=Marasmius crinis-equi TaxID=585013 RepID=A0ABR3FXB3_9AGAR